MTPDHGRLGAVRGGKRITVDPEAAKAAIRVAEDQQSITIAFSRADRQEGFPDRPARNRLPCLMRELRSPIGTAARDRQ
ncbi:hypothetical protein A7X12_21195 [Sphingomonas sp. TDK1]|nr:hypothetical protein A7X12_21195 [Sphingomonas sp. TDK1]